MKPRIFVGAAVLAVLGCNHHGDIGTIAPLCSAPDSTTVFSGDQLFDGLTVQAGTFTLALPDGSIQQCPTTGCTTPTVLVDDPSTLIGGIASPAYVTTSGTRTFWVNDTFAVDETPATVNCIGCAGSSSVQWIDGIGGSAYGVFADASNVYVLEDDPTLTSVRLLACPVSAPCMGEPRVVYDNVDREITMQQIASDGTNVYLARPSHADVVRIDPAGNVTPVVTWQTVTALALDSGTLYYAAAGSSLAKIKADGTGKATMLACGNDPITSVAVDAASANVYFLTGPSSSIIAQAMK